MYKIMATLPPVFLAAPSHENPIISRQFSSGNKYISIFSAQILISFPCLFEGKQVKWLTAKSQAR